MNQRLGEGVRGETLPTADILSSEPVISSWDEHKTTILRVTGRHEGGWHGVGAGQGGRDRGWGKRNPFTHPLAFLPRDLGLFQPPGLCPREAQ